MSKAPNFKRTKLACYAAYFTMSSIFCIPPLLFVPLRETFGISYTLLGTLVLVNFITQLGVDLIFTFFSRHINHGLMLRVMPLITSLGMAVYALIPTLFPSFAYGGLLIGTVIFSLSAGLSEALLSPTIAAIPSKNPQRDMSMLHSLYAFGVLTMVVIGTLFLRLFGTENWHLLMLMLGLFPIIPALLFALSPLPEMGGHSAEGSDNPVKRHAVGMAFCVGCIFFGSCAENAMSNWISGYMENALGIEKTLGDILGVAVFAVLLGLVRIGYAAFGKRITPVLFIGMSGAVVCYLVAGLCPGVALPFAACIMTGLFTSMLWPGALIFMEENIPAVGVTAYALMAAGGDMGASLAPQLLGIVVDGVSATPAAAEIGLRLGISAEQVGLKAGMLVTALFPLIGVGLLWATVRYFKNIKKEKP